MADGYSCHCPPWHVCLDSRGLTVLGSRVGTKELVGGGIPVAKAIRVR